MKPGISWLRIMRLSFRRHGAYIRDAAPPTITLFGAWRAKTWTIPIWIRYPSQIYDKTFIMNDKFSLKDKVIVVTGGTGILGNSFVNGIVEAGGSVGILGRNKAVAEERAELINSKGGKAISLVADVMDTEELKAARNKVIDAFGRIDGL